MKPSPPPRSRLAGLVNLALQLQDDEEVPTLDLRRRDRAIGQELAPLHDDPKAQILAWLERVCPPPIVRTGQRVVRVQTAAVLLLIVAGLLTGWLAAMVVFRYDGTHPVNVIRVLAVFVFAQLGLLALLAILLLPPGGAARIPGLRGLQTLLACLSPGRLLQLSRRFLPRDFVDWLQDAVGRGRANHHLFGAVQRWTMLTASQAFAMAFNIGALVGCLGLVAFSDLAFSWNTTLQLETADLHRITHLLATPWSSVAPGADPSPALIESTRYFRYHEGMLPAWQSVGAEDPGRLGGWWPFLAACIAVYGLAPRLILAGVSRWRLGVAVDRALVQMPGAPGVLSRLNHSLVETGSPEPEPATPAEANADPASPLPREAEDTPWIDVLWSDAPDHGFDPDGLSPLHAGGARSIGEDQQTIEALAGLDPATTIRIRVKAWEPPVGDFIDFLGDLRARLAPRQPILVDPAGTGPDSPPSPAQHQTWSRRVRRIGDPWITVIAGSGVGTLP